MASDHPVASRFGAGTALSQAAHSKTPAHLERSAAFNKLTVRKLRVTRMQQIHAIEGDLYGLGHLPAQTRIQPVLGRDVRTATCRKTASKVIRCPKFIADFN